MAYDLDTELIEKEKQQQVHSYLGGYGRLISKLEGTHKGPDTKIMNSCYFEDGKIVVVHFNDGKMNATVVEDNDEYNEWESKNTLKIWFKIENKWVQRYKK